VSLKPINFAGLVQFAKKNSYIVRSNNEHKQIMWKYKRDRHWNFCDSVNETYLEISLHIERRKTMKTFRFLSEGF